MTTKNCANGPKLVLKDLCKKSFVRNVLYSGIFNLIVGFLHKNYTFCPLDCLKDFHSFHSWLTKMDKFVRFRCLTKIHPALKQDDGAFEDK